MKGGITSGVVYPLAICELAKHFRFANVGGTSAGAIAAAAAAAAEYGRGRPGAGFERLAQLPEWLGTAGHLFHLFQPQRPTRGLFALATAVIGQDARWRKAGRVARALVGYFSGWLLVGGVPAACVVYMAWRGLTAGPDTDSAGAATWAFRIATMIGAVGFGLIGTAVVVALGLLRRATRALPANGFGLCRGFDAGEATTRPGLVRWLDAELDALAGRTHEQDVPLTFGHLWGTRPDPARTGPTGNAETHASGRATPDPTYSTPSSATADDPTADDGMSGAEPEERARRAAERLPDDVIPPASARHINLEMVTTNLTHGRPYHLPFRERMFYFDAVEMDAYFTPRIARWMQAMSPRTAIGVEGQQLFALPLPADLPVTVAARLSLSFPGLISAVPLYAVDFGRPPGMRTHPERCWFSDGGLSTNFPIHFFDALLPRWPTFGINLRSFTHDYPRQADEEENIYMAKGNGDGLAEWWTRFEQDPLTEAPKSGLGRLFGFVGALLEAMRNWRDNAQVRMPGFRDRVVYVKLDEGLEGGLNLSMAPEVIAALTARGAAAGARLAARYAGPPPVSGAPVQVSWENHRWVRYRNTMDLLQSALRRFRSAFRNPEPGDPPVSELVARPKGVAPASYQWSSHQRSAAPELQTEALLELLDTWDRAKMDFCDGAPRPTPDLRAVPRI